jgi:hypothetical protein
MGLRSSGADNNHLPTPDFFAGGATGVILNATHHFYVAHPLVTPAPPKKNLCVGIPQRVYNLGPLGAKKDLLAERRLYHV